MLTLWINAFCFIHVLSSKAAAAPPPSVVSFAAAVDPLMEVRGVIFSFSAGTNEVVLIGLRFFIFWGVWKVELSFFSCLNVALLRRYSGDFRWSNIESVPRGDSVKSLLITVWLFWNVLIESSSRSLIPSLNWTPVWFESGSGDSTDFYPSPLFMLDCLKIICWDFGDYMLEIEVCAELLATAAPSSRKLWVVSPWKPCSFSIKLHEFISWNNRLRSYLAVDS